MKPLFVSSAAVKYTPSIPVNWALRLVATMKHPPPRIVKKHTKSEVLALRTLFLNLRFRQAQGPLTEVDPMP